MSTLSLCALWLYDVYSVQLQEESSTGNTLLLRREKNQSIYSPKFHNLLEFASLKHSHVHAQMYTEAGSFLRIPKKGVIVIINEMYLIETCMDGPKKENIVFFIIFY